MAKKKKEEQEEEIGSYSQIDSLIAEIEKDFGGVVKSGKSLIDNPPQIIPIGPALDGITHGGVPRGSFFLLTGPEKCGKTITALTFAANAQKPENGNSKIMYLSIENRIDQLTLSGIKGLNLNEPDFLIVKSEKGRILSANDFLNIGLKFLKSCENGILILDSSSALVNPSIIKGGIGTSDFGGINKIISTFVDLAAPIARVNGNIVVCIQQMYTNVGKYGTDMLEKVAVKLKYQSDVRLLCKKSSYDPQPKEGEEPTEPTGQKQTWLCKRSALGPPGRITESFVRYGIGIDKNREILIQAMNFGLVELSGSWYKFHFLTEELKKNTDYEKKDIVSVQGAEKASQLLEEQPLWLEALSKGVREILALPAGK